MSLIRKHVAVLQAWACLALVSFTADYWKHVHCTGIGYKQWQYRRNTMRKPKVRENPASWRSRGFSLRVLFSFILYACVWRLECFCWQNQLFLCFYTLVF